MLGTASRRRPAPAPAGTAPALIGAPLFRSLLEEFREGGRSVVLDLGPACPETVALLSEFRCRLDIADLAQGLDEFGAIEDEEPARLGDAAEALLPPRRPEATDVVLCWDLLNYLRPAALTALMDCIAARGRRGTRVHCLVAYAQPRMSGRPGRFAPQADGQLRHRPAGGPDRPAPRYTPEDLGRCLRGYTHEGARLLQNGMQEFLFRL